jgi:acyl-CoA thioester hydrolase
MTSPRISESTLRVRFAETDAQGIVYYANFFVWFEVGRVNYLREVGFDFWRRREEGVTFVIGEARCKYHASARFDDQILVRTWISQVKQRSFVFSYEVLNQDSGTLLADGESSQVMLDPNTFKPIPIPEEFGRLLLLEQGAHI